MYMLKREFTSSFQLWFTFWGLWKVNNTFKWEYTKSWKIVCFSRTAPNENICPHILTLRIKVVHVFNHKTARSRLLDYIHSHLSFIKKIAR